MRKTKAETARTKESIVHAAEALFIKEGYEKVSLEDIAAEAGVTRGAVHWHFKNKKGLLQAIRDRIVMPLEVLEHLILEEKETVEPLQALSETITKSFTTFENDPHIRRLMKIIMQFEFNEEGERLAEKTSEQRAREVVTEILAEAQKRSSFSVPWTPESGALAFVGLLSGLINEWAREETTFALRPDAEEVLMAVLDIWGAQLSHSSERSS